MADSEVNKDKQIAADELPMQTDESKNEDADQPLNETSFSFKTPQLIGPKPLRNEHPELAETENAEPAETVNTVVPDVPTKPKETGPSNAVVLPYKPPSWSGTPELAYKVEVLKGGVIVQKISLSDKACYIVGRMTACDIVLEHPSISRYHAAITYRAQGTEENPVGYYLYDLKSTHGTWLNKLQVEPRCYYRLRVGYMIKFGGSSRVFIVQGPEDDQDEESELTVTELKEQRKKQEELLEKSEREDLAKEGEAKESEGSKESDAESGIDWGMGEDAVEDTDLTENPFALDAAAPNEDLYVDDPKRTLRGWFEREGYTLDYKVEEKGYSQFLCRVQLPLDSPTGQPLYAEASVKGKKKEAVIACALEACKILDRHGVLRQATHESRKRKERNWEEDDFYDSDEDTFLDRTGTIEKKRQQRIHKAGKEKQTVETYDSLLAKLNQVKEEIKHLEDARLESLKRANEEENDDEDALDAYMATIKNETSIDKCNRTAQRLQLSQLKQEEMRLQQLVNIAAPANFPEFKTPNLPCPKLQQSTYKVPKNVKEKPKIHPEVKISPTKPDLQKAENDFDEETKDETKLIENIETKIETQIATETENIQTLLSKDHTIEDNVKEPSGDSSKIPADNGIKLKEPPAPPKVTMKITSRKKVKKNWPTSFDYDDSNPDYAMWLPPEGQSGDGKTKLNEKYGY